MATLEELLNQQTQLQQLIDTARAEKKEEVVKSIKADMEKFGITAKDLGFQSKGKKSKAEDKDKVVKYRNPENEKETYSGHGRQPNWLVKAIADGKKLEDFKIAE